MPSSTPGETCSADLIQSITVSRIQILSVRNAGKITAFESDAAWHHAPHPSVYLGPRVG